jgi:hypothetical protein
MVRFWKKAMATAATTDRVIGALVCNFCGFDIFHICCA